MKGSLWLPRWCFWQVLHWDISSTAPLILSHERCSVHLSLVLDIYLFQNEIHECGEEFLVANYAELLFDHPWTSVLITTYFISVVPVWPVFCGCFILDLRPPIHDNRLQLLKFWILLSHLSVSGAYGFWKVFRVQDMNFKLIRPIWCFDR